MREICDQIFFKQYLWLLLYLSNKIIQFSAIKKIKNEIDDRMVSLKTLFGDFLVKFLVTSSIINQSNLRIDVMV